MKITITARKFELTDEIKERVEKRFAKLDKFFRDDAEARVTMSVEKERQKMETTIYSQGMIYRVEEITTDMYTSIDKTVSAVERKIRKNKTRLEKRLRVGSLANAHEVAEVERVEEEHEFKIVKTKLFEAKPMSAEEAVLQMNLLNHEFFVYENDVTGKANIVYQRKDKDYGLIEIK